MPISLFRKFIEGPEFSPQTLGERGLAFILRMASCFYGLGVDFRNWAYGNGIYKINKLPRPVISVGNLTVGGTGKTPMAAWLARYFLAKGLRPCILSRGYRREAEKEILLLKGGQGHYDYKKLGDEPALLAQRLPGAVIALGAYRYQAALKALEKYSPDLFILDDGFQHQKLARNLDILLLDSTNPWGNGYLLPRGPLREPRQSMGRADLTMLTKAEKDKDYRVLKEELRSWNNKATVLSSGYKITGLQQIGTSGELAPEELADKNVLAFAGLARPESFRQSLDSLGANIVKFMTYPDHHPYNAEDVSEIAGAAQAAGADYVVTTEKDAVRLEGMALPLPFWSLGIEMEFFEDKKILEILLNNLLVNRNEK